MVRLSDRMKGYLIRRKDPDSTNLYLLTIHNPIGCADQRVHLTYLLAIPLPIST